MNEHPHPSDTAVPNFRAMDYAALLNHLDEIVATLRAADVERPDGHGVAGDLIDNLEGHMASVKMRVGQIAERLDNHSKES